ncbi:MAG: hypothetical protein EBX61_09935, partial [Betaproteobacteria bacterium]|nr:hypothetical protein [Betaproteobacteria bacterium]
THQRPQAANQRLQAHPWQTRRAAVQPTYRALLKHLAQISDQEIVELNIPTAQPLWVEFDQDLNYQAHRYLGKVEMTDREIDRATASVAAQGNSDTARIECR